MSIDGENKKGVITMLQSNVTAFHVTITRNNGAMNEYRKLVTQFVVNHLCREEVCSGKTTKLIQ